MSQRSSTTPVVFAILLALLVSGCATIKPMALGEKAELSTVQESVALMTIRTSNRYKPDWQPDVNFVFVWRDEKDASDRYSFKVGDPYAEVKKESLDFLVSLSLPPGKYKFKGIMALSGGFPIRGTFTIPVYSRFELKPQSVVYLGRIEAVVRERKSDDELRAGPVIPLIDQAVTGASGGTFDVKIFDNHDEDLAAFKQKYPFLDRYPVEKAVLPPWTKPTDEEMN